MIQILDILQIWYKNHANTIQILYNYNTMYYISFLVAGPFVPIAIFPLLVLIQAEAGKEESISEVLMIVMIMTMMVMMMMTMMVMMMMMIVVVMMISVFKLLYGACFVIFIICILFL